MADGNPYHVKSMTYLSQSREELAKDDLSQASEKGWVAAASIVKAVASERRWGHRSHQGLFSVVDRLADEAQDEELRTQFGIAGMLHTNFYEGWLARPSVEAHLAKVTQFVERMEQFLDRQ